MRADSPIARELASRLPNGAVSTRTSDLLATSIDLWPRHILELWSGGKPALAEAVVWPQSTTDLQTIVGFASAKGVPLVPYGAGSSVVGGATALPGQIVVDLKRMARILAIDREGLTASAEVGILGELFERELSRAGYTQGHFPSSIYCSSLGGWIATRGAGQMSSRYGKIEDQVLGGEIVTGDGALVRIREAPVRGPLLETLIGSEGTLGMWASATVRIHPLPKARAWRGFQFPRLSRALEAAEAWLRAGLSPAVVRIYDPVDSLLQSTTHDHRQRDRGPSRLAWLGAHFPRLLGRAADRLAGGCRVIVGLQGDAEAVDRELQLLVALALERNGHDQGELPGRAWFKRRYAVSYRQSNAFRAGVAVDTMEVACGWERLEPVYEAVRRAGREAGAQVLAHFSHVYLEGASIYFTFAIPAERGARAYDALWEKCLGAAIDHGGNVSHHHGIGRLKAPAFQRVLGGAIPILRAQAARLDPAGILNPAVFALKAQPQPGPHPQAATQLWQPSESSLWATASPTERLGELEARLARNEQTLGPCAALLASLEVGEAARRGWLLRKDPQLHAIEPLVLGVDGSAEDQPFRFVPAPRAAMGAELWPALMSSRIERIWLRTLPHMGSERHWLCDRPQALARARAIARHEALGSASIVLRGRGDRCVVSVRFLAGPLGEDRLARCAEILGEPARGEDVLAAGVPTTCGADSVFFSGLWLKASQALSQLPPGMGYVLPFIDPVGVAGFVCGAEGETLSAGAQSRVVLSLGICAGREKVERTLPRDSASHGRGSSQSSTDSTDSAESAPWRPLRVRGHVHELDNCTYCPKLCRFSCPVAVADGGEALTPRQLMLTVNLDRRRQLRLADDVVDRLFSCVDCRGCRSFCDHGNDVASALIDARAELFAHGRVPDRLAAVLRALASTGRLPDRPATDHPSSLLDPEPSVGARTLVFLGCQNTRNDVASARAILAMARKQFGPVRLVSGSLACCGHPLWRWGDRASFELHARRFASQFADADRVIVDDPGCAYAFSALYPKVGVETPTILTTTELVDAKRLVVKDPHELVPCDDEWATRYLAEPTLRTRLSSLSLAKGSVLEGEAGSAGGMLLPFYDAALAREVARAHASDLLGGGGSRILTASPTVRRCLRASGVEVVDLFELWAGPETHPG